MNKTANSKSKSKSFIVLVLTAILVLVALPAVSAVPRNISNSTLVAYYPMDESTASEFIKDQQGRADANSTGAGVEYNQTGFNGGKAIFFNANQARFRIGFDFGAKEPTNIIKGINNSGSFTIVMGYKEPNSAGPSDDINMFTITDQINPIGNNFLRNYHTTNGFQFFRFNTDQNSLHSSGNGDNPSDNTWVRKIFEFDSTIGTSVYEDNVLGASCTTLACKEVMDWRTPATIFIGGFVGNPSEVFYLDDLCIFNITLTDAQKEALNTNACSELIIQEAIVDDIPPSFGFQSQNNTNVKRFDNLNVSINVSDNIGLSSITLAHNQTGTLTNVSTKQISGTSSNSTFTFQITNIRGHQIAYMFTINDTNGNANQTGLFQFEVQNTPPETPTILFPTENLITYLQPMDINITFPNDNDLDGININYYIDDILNQTSTDNVTFNASDGIYNLKVSIDDGIDFSPNVSVTFTIDTINPIITINLPINNSLHSKDISTDIVCTNINLNNLSYVFFNSTDLSIQQEINDTQGITLSTLNNPISISGLGDGSYTLNISCTDNASLTDHTFINLNLDQTIPIISTSINNQTPEINSIIQINSTCSDINGISSLSIANNITGTLTNVTAINIPNESITYIYNHTTPSANQTISNVFTCEDAVLNSIQSSEILYSTHIIPEDLIPPSIISTSISNSTPIEDDIIQINITCTDLSSGLSDIFIANNATGTLTNVSTISFNNATTGTAIFNHTAVLNTVAHQFTCSDANDNQAQSAEILYTSTALPSISSITGAVVLPIEGTLNVVGVLALFILILGILGFGKLSKK